MDNYREAPDYPRNYVIQWYTDLPPETILESMDGGVRIMVLENKNDYLFKILLLMSSHKPQNEIIDNIALDKETFKVVDY